MASSDLVTTFDDLVPEPNNRGLLVGTTGCGKSTLAARLLDQIAVKSVVIIDPKGMFDYPGVIVDNPDMLPSAAKQSDVIIFRAPPDTTTLVDDYNRVLRWVYNRQNTLLYIDEIYGLSENGYTYPSMLRGIYTRGRERGITVLGASQRPRGIPSFCRSEVQYYYMFDLGLKDDRKALAEELGDKVSDKLDEYVFWFYKRQAGKEPYKVKLRLE